VRPVGEAGDIANVGKDFSGEVDALGAVESDVHPVSERRPGPRDREAVATNGRRAGKSAGSKRAAATRAGDRQVRVWRCVG
jgi:hypothetical protein